MYVATIDTGTTNSRVLVWRNGVAVTEAERPVGVRDTAITGSPEALKGAVRDAIAEALGQTGVTTTDDVLFLASGMITSNVGLYEVPHLLAPAGVSELAAGMRAAHLPDIIDHPIWFIPGVKSHDGPITLENCDQMDIMRGEETETIGVLHALHVRKPAVLILPGSHSKFVKTDTLGRIAASMTTLSGELLDVVTKNTLISSSLDHRFAETILPDALLRGAAFGLSLGLGRSAFLIRLLDLFGDLDLAGRANVLLGAVLSTDIQAMKNSRSMLLAGDEEIIVGGKRALRDAFVTLLRGDPFFTGTISIVPDDIRSVSALGAIEIARARGLLTR